MRRVQRGIGVLIAVAWAAACSASSDIQDVGGTSSGPGGSGPSFGKGGSGGKAGASFCDVGTITDRRGGDSGTTPGSAGAGGSAGEKTSDGSAGGPGSAGDKSSGGSAGGAGSAGDRNGGGNAGDTDSAGSTSVGGRTDTGGAAGVGAGAGAVTMGGSGARGASIGGAGEGGFGAHGGEGNSGAQGGRAMDPYNTKPFASGGSPALDLTKACPEQIPLASETERVSCSDEVLCNYVDGSVCVCGPCDDGAGLCWTCALSPQPLGCPRAVPENGDSCPWSDAFCMYGDCQRWNSVVAGCCDGKWRVGGDACLGQIPIP